MAGVKGKSGRKTRYHEAKEGDLFKLCTEWIINNFTTFDKATKVRVATEIAKKGIAQNITHKGDFTVVKEELQKAQDRYNRSLIPEVAEETQIPIHTETSLN